MAFSYSRRAEGLEVLLHTGQRLRATKRVGCGVGRHEAEAFVESLIRLECRADPQGEVSIASPHRLRFYPRDHASGDPASAQSRVDRDVLDVEDRAAIRPDDRARKT